MESPPGDGSASRTSPDVASTAETRRAAQHGLSPRTWPRRYQGFWVVALLLIAIAFAWVRLTIGGPRTTQLFVDVVVTIGATAAAVGLTIVGWRETDQPTQGWRLLAIGAWFEVLGEVSWTTYSILLGTVPYPGIPDIFYLLGYPFLVAGFVFLASNPDDPRQRTRLVLDGLVVGTALISLGWHFVLERILAAGTLDTLAISVTLAYPIADVLLGSIAFVIAVNSRGPRRIPLLLVAAGILTWTFGDTAFAYLEFSGRQAYDELTLSWLIGDLLIALGAFHPTATAPPITGNRRRYELRELVSPYVPFLLAMGLMGYQGVIGNVDVYDFIIAGIVILVLIARQTYVLTDATRLSRELEENERTLARRNNELLLINRIVRHDIRNDMAVANGWAGELTDHVDDAGRPMLDRILTTTQHTIDLTENLRDFVAALEPGEEANLEPIPLRETLEETLLSRRETYPEATFTTGDIPDVDVQANPLLATVFRNLLNNAVQHSDTDHPRIEIDAHSTDDTVQIRIADNGPGIPDDRKETVFHRDTPGLDSAGSGIGLYLVDTLVTHYGGDVWIEDNDPRGAIFVVELDIAE